MIYVNVIKTKTRTENINIIQLNENYTSNEMKLF